ncbi:MAG: VWA domain-containing protein, partial [Thermoanaerobaculia bacterium]
MTQTADSLQRFVPVLLAGWLLVVQLASAQQTERESFAGRTDVIDVQIPVNVVDKRGEAVRGLTAEDFEIYDEGELQEISGFEVVDLELLEPGETRSEIEQAVPAAARRHFLLVFDLSFSRPHSVTRAREAARQFVLEEVHETDLVSVATHSVERGARLLVTFTPDRSQIARAIDTLGAPRLLNLARVDPLRFIIEDPQMGRSMASSELNDLTNQGARGALEQSILAHLRVIAKEMAKSEKSFARGRIGSWSRSMAELARYLDSIRGRKHVIYFSEGWDGRLFLGRTPDAEDRATQEDLANIASGQTFLVDSDDIYGNTGLQNQMHNMVEEFRRADCVIQAVDISGLRADDVNEERTRSVGRDALFYVANETGGELFEDANDFGAELREVLERSSVTYLLSFQPDDIEFDGAYHRLKIRVKEGKGGRISARKGYYAPRPYEELHPLEKGLIASDAIASASVESDFDMQVLAAAFRANEEQAYVPVIVEVEGRRLLEGTAGDRLPVEFFAYVTDQNG